MEAVILAGGFGTRLRPVISDVPKPMAPICGKPFLHYLVGYLKQNGVSKIVLCTGYLHEAVTRFFGNEYLGITIDYSVENEPLGTGGAFVNALPLICGAECLLCNGDSYYNFPVTRLSDAHRRTDADVTIALVDAPHEQPVRIRGSARRQNSLV